MARQRSVREGQRYVQRAVRHSRHVIWQVGSVRTGGTPFPHARLVNVDDPLRSKTIACETLADPSFYELLSDGPSDRPGDGPALPVAL